MSDDRIRKLSRLGNEMHFESALATLRLLPGRYEAAIVFVLLLRRCAADWFDGKRFRRPETITRSSSINALASSLHRSYATTHRHVMLLIRHGMVVNAENGVAVSNDPAVEMRILDLIKVAHEGMVRLTEDLQPHMTFARPDSIPSSRLPLRILTTALDLWLVPYEYAAEPVTDWTSKLVWIVIVVANVRHVTIDPDLSERYASVPTPDDLRQPITARQIGRITGLSYGTVYRHCQSLDEKDVIKYDRGGWLLVSRQLKNRDVDEGVKALLGYFRKRIDELAGFGFDPSRPARFYMDRRPDYAPITAGSC